MNGVCLKWDVLSLEKEKGKALTKMTCVGRGCSEVCLVCFCCQNPLYLFHMVLRGRGCALVHSIINMVCGSFLGESKHGGDIVLY